ncbi:MAG: hypothetical protein KF861_23410 [Planctomycetaceae bacterium]|nr:hypothetical protein [Planctomycetaceae bacterium]
MKSAQMSAAKSMRSLRAISGDEYDPASEPSDPWIQQAAAEGRGERTIEKSTEPEWFMNIIRSPKARDIENNLGFE